MQHVLPNLQVQRITALTAALVIGGLGGAGIAIVARDDGTTQASSPAVSAPSHVQVFPEAANNAQAAQRSAPSHVQVFPEAANNSQAAQRSAPSHVQVFAEAANNSQAAQPAQGQRSGGRLP
jgi:hypothetical protein